MPHHIPTPALIKVEAAGNKFGAIEVYPQAIRGGDGLEIVGWTVKDAEQTDRGLYDVLALTVLKKKLMHKVCEKTFENIEQDSIFVRFSVGGESWEYQMRAIEREHETVHYEIEIEGEWMDMIDVYVGDIFNEEFHVFAEGEVRPTVDFGNDDAILEKMV